MLERNVSLDVPVNTEKLHLLDTILNYREAMIATDMIEVSDTSTDDKKGEVDNANDHEPIMDPNQPEGVDEKQAMRDKLMSLLKQDSNDIIMKKDKIEMKNHLLLLQQEQEKSEMKKHLQHLKSEMVHKNNDKQMEETDVNTSTNETMLGFEQTNSKVEKRTCITLMGATDCKQNTKINCETQQYVAANEDSDELQEDEANIMLNKFNKTVTLMGSISIETPDAVTSTFNTTVN
eukprot:1105843_1